MIKLLMGFQPLLMGEITIGGVNINNIPNNEIRQNIFYIPQKPKLFNRTLYENIIFFGSSNFLTIIFSKCKS